MDSSYLVDSRYPFEDSRFYFVDSRYFFEDLKVFQPKVSAFGLLAFFALSVLCQVVSEPQGYSW
jgi:hypothetical protein